MEAPAGFQEGGVLPPPESGIDGVSRVDPHRPDAAGARGVGRIVSLLRSAGCVFAEEEAALLLAEATSPAELFRNIKSRINGVPLEHILGWAEFAGGRVLVEPGVFVPRRRTELLVGEAVALLRNDALAAPPVVVDLCCGSGAVGMAVLRQAPRVALHAADIEPAAREP